MKQKTIIILVIIIILIIIFAFYLNYENTDLEVSSYEIINDRILKEFDNFKIVQVSDFHNTNSNKLTNNLISDIKKQKPNIIVLTGDLIDSRKTDIETAINFIKKIKDIAPIYFVSGNHEARINSYSKLKNEMKNNDVILLENTFKVITLGNSQINILGINDPSMIQESLTSDEEIIKTEINNLEYDKNNFTILLSHRPEVYNVYVEKEIDLVLTGHAHGGQIRIPFIGGLVAPNQGLFPKYTSGIIKDDKTTMVISRGIGNSIFPFRINNNPELVVITLKNKK